jgi:hypothetical protein
MWSYIFWSFGIIFKGSTAKQTCFAIAKNFIMSYTVMTIKFIKTVDV